jgi:hypothetical protein
MACRYQSLVPSRCASGLERLHRAKGSTYDSRLMRLQPRILAANVSNTSARAAARRASVPVRGAERWVRDCGKVCSIRCGFRTSGVGPLCHREQRRGSVSMPNSVPCVIIPHDLFVEYQRRRREKAVQPIEPDSPTATDSGDMSRRPLVALSEPPSKGQC